MLPQNLRNTFDVVLTNDIEDLTLTFKVRDTRIAYKWFTELLKDYELFETNRLSNWGEHNFIEELNYHINVINEYDPVIDRTVKDDSVQDDLNYLHKFFEDLRGEIDEGTTWYNSSPDHVKHSLNRFNVLIHQLESSLRTKNKHPTVVVTFKDRPRIELTDKDCEHFTYKWEQGCVYINYCQVGKTVLDAFKDNDKIAEAIRPQTHYSSDFMIKFGPSSNWFLYKIRSFIIKLWLKKRNFKLDRLNIGMIPVADLVTPVEHKTLFKFKRVKSVCTK